MTHTLETTGIARVVARALRLNEDLVEAIGLGHDTGHPPFGHAGEEALDEALRERFGGRLPAQRAVAARSPSGSNLTYEVRDGILTHTGEQEPETLEGKIVRIVDRVAYINHDIDDAIRYGMLEQGDLPRDEIEVLGPTGLGADRHARPRPDRDVGARRRHRPERRGRRARCSRCARFMFERVYLGPETRAEHERARATIQRIFDALADRGDGADEITEFIAGMTDRFALDVRCAARLSGAHQGHHRRGRQAGGRLRRVVEERTALRKAGGRLTGRCPFHEERTPSFSVNPVKGLYYCFGCGEGGDVITFVRETQGLDFAGAIEWLADRFHIPLEYEEARPERRRATPPARAAVRAARPGGDVLRALPLGLAGRLARARLPRRARPRRGDLPRVPARARARRQHARRARRREKGFTAEELRAAGLTRQRGDDYFQRRLVFPLADARGRVRRLPGAAAARGRPAAGEVREHARVGALPQGLAALRARQGARRDRARGPRVRRRGEHRRDRAAAGGLRARRRVDGHGAHRAAAARARRG